MIEKTEEEQVQLLKEYLGQYHECIKYKQDLEKRLERIQAEIESPLGGKGYSPLPSNNTIGAGAASFILRKAEIEERIIEQKNKVIITINNVMDIIDYLQQGSRERLILEYRYIDFVPWKVIHKKMNLTKTPCFDCTNKAYNKLLSYKRVRTILEEYEQEQAEHYV